MVTEVGFETCSVPWLDEGGGDWLEPPVEGAGLEGPVASSPPPQAAVARASVARTELKKRRADIVTSCESLHRFRGHRVEHGGNNTRRCHRQLTGIPSDRALAQVIVRIEPGDTAPSGYDLGRSGRVPTMDRIRGLREPERSKRRVL